MPPTAPPGWIRHCYKANDIELIIDVPGAQPPPDASQRDCQHGNLDNMQDHTPDEARDESLAGEDHSPEALGVASLFSAIALAERDHLLQHVSSWLGCDLNWRLNTAGENSVAIDVTLNSTSDQSQRIGLSFKHAQSTCPEIPPELHSSVRVHAHRQKVRMCVADLVLGESDRQKIGPGCCVLLPNTFSNSFVVSLLEQDGSESIGRAVLDREAHTISPAAASVSPFFGSKTSAPIASSLKNVQPDTAALRFVLSEDIEIDLPLWNQMNEWKQMKNMDESNSATLDSNGALRDPKQAMPIELCIPMLTGQSVSVEQFGAQISEAKLIQVGEGLAVLFDEYG